LPDRNSRSIYLSSFRRGTASYISFNKKLLIAVGSPAVGVASLSYIGFEHKLFTLAAIASDIFAARVD
jgi:hypothetical protein